MRRELSLVIPAYNAYNEEGRLAGVLSSYHDYLQKNFSRFELIVVPNNCSDNTPKIAGEFARRHRHTKVIVIPGRSGSGTPSCARKNSWETSPSRSCSATTW